MPTFTEFVRSTNPIAMWRVHETPGDNVAHCLVDPNQNGSHANVTLGQLGLDENTCGDYDGIASYTDIYSPTFRDAFNGLRGGVVIYARVNDVIDWTDGVVRFIYRIYVDANNRVDIYKSANNTITWLYRAGGAANQTLDQAGHAETIFMGFGMTWDQPADEVRFFFNGAQQGAAAGGMGVWAGLPTNIRTVIGAGVTTPNNVWKGRLAYGVHWDYPPSQAQMELLTSRPYGMGTTLDSFSSPGTNPLGIAWDGHTLWLTDSVADRIYQLELDGTVIQDFALPAGEFEPRGLGWFGEYLLLTGATLDQVFIIDPRGGTLIESFGTPSIAPVGVAFDGKNLYSCDNSTRRFYLYDGVSAVTVKDWLSAGTGLGDICFAGRYLVHTDHVSDLVSIIDPVDEVVVHAFECPGSQSRGVAFDGLHLWISDSDDDEVYQVSLGPSSHQVCDLWAIECDGADTVLNCGNPAKLNDIPDGGAFTAEGWIRAVGWGEGNAGYIFSKTSWRMGVVNATGLDARVLCGGGVAVSDSGLDEFTIGQDWRHVVMTYDETGAGTPAARTVYLAVDGVWVASYPTQNASSGAYNGDAANDLTLGNNTALTRTFAGSLGWQRISDGVRYNPAGGNFTPPDRCQLPEADGDTLWLGIGPEGEGVTVYDRSASPSDGTLADGAWSCACFSEE